MPSDSGQAEPYAGERPYIFISYARKDLDVIQPILAELADLGVRLWWDADLHAGEDYADRLQRRVDGCASLVVFLSRESTRKKALNWVLTETKYAAEAHKEIIPVRLSEFQLGLDWKALVEHRQMLNASGGSTRLLVDGILARAKELGCVDGANGGTPPPSPPRRERKTRRKRNDAWIASCRDAIETLQGIRDRIAPSDETDTAPDEAWSDDYDFGAESEEPPDDLLHFPLRVDTDPRYARCRELIAAAAQLRVPSVPLSERLPACLSLTAKVPASRDPELDFSLCLCHLYHLIALVGIHADEGEPLGVEARERLDRAARILTRMEAWTVFSYELWTLVDLALGLLRLEVAIMIGLPDTKSRRLAESKGALAYPDEWRSRIADCEALERTLWHCTANARTDPGAVAHALRAEWTFGEWLGCCYRDLAKPHAFSPIPAQPIDQVPDAQRRGAERLIRVRKAIGGSRADHGSAGVLLYHCHRRLPRTSWGYDYAFESEAVHWILGLSRLASESSTLFEESLRRPESARLLARLLVQYPSDRIFGWNSRFNREHVLIGLAKECARQGSIIGRRGTPPAWAESEDVPPLLWHEAQEVILGDASYAADLLLLAGACDPERKSFRAARLARYFPPAMKERVAEIRSVPEALRLQRAGWLPSTCYDEHSDRAAEDVRALFAE